MRDDHIETALRRPDTPLPATPGAYRRVLRRRARRTRVLVTGGVLALAAVVGLGVAGVRALPSMPEPAPVAPPTTDPLQLRLPNGISEGGKLLGPVRIAARTDGFVLLTQLTKPSDAPDPMVCAIVASTAGVESLTATFGSGGFCRPTGWREDDEVALVPFPPVTGKPDRLDNGLSGEVGPGVARVRVTGRCHYRPVEAEVTPSAEPGEDAGYFIVPPQPPASPGPTPSSASTPAAGKSAARHCSGPCRAASAPATRLTPGTSRTSRSWRSSGASRAVSSWSRPSPARPG
jgi:hypothetical protein